MSFKTRMAWRAKPPRRAGLLDRGSLTARLQARGAFAVHVGRQELALPTLDEASSLGLKRDRLLWVREVALHIDGAPLVFAHTVLPCRPRGPLTVWLARLGNGSLGEQLFAHPGFIRGAISCRRLDQRHALFQRAIGALQLSAVPPTTLWARRSRFTFGAQSLLVTEVFSPAWFGA